MMTKEEMRIAIAEKCGKKWDYVIDGRLYITIPQHGSPDDEIEELPNTNYPEDLNAMHEAENLLTKSNRWDDYCYSLCQVVKRDCGNACHEILWFCATATQRAEAFCRVFWPERFNEKENK